MDVEINCFLVKKVLIAEEVRKVSQKCEMNELQELPVEFPGVIYNSKDRGSPSLTRKSAAAFLSLF